MHLLDCGERKEAGGETVGRRGREGEGSKIRGRD
jgi:hypothetical protein